MSCLSEKIFNQINENHQVKLRPSTTRLSTANQMPIQIKGTVSVPIKIGAKRYEHTFYVLTEAASDCLLGLDFRGTNNCDALFSEGKLKIDRNTLVHLYRKQYSFDEKQAYRVVALEKVLIPPQHVMIVPGTIPGWKAPPVARVASLEPHERLINNENQKAQDALFTFEKRIVENVKNEIIREINNNCRADFRNLIDDFSDIF